MLVSTKGAIETPSTRYRIHALVPSLEARGWAIRLLTPSMSFDRRGASFARDLLQTVRPWDVLFVQRPGRRREESLLLRIASRRASVVALDVDDPVDRRGAFAIAAQRADVVFAASRAAAEANRDIARVELAPTPIDPNSYRLPRSPNDPPVIGWIGDGLSYADPLVRMVQALGTAASGWRLRIVGVGLDGPLERRLRRASAASTLELVPGIDWTNEDDVARTIAGFDVGLAPFRHAQGGSFKTIQYLAAGVIPIVEAGGEAQHHVEAVFGEAAEVVEPGDAVGLSAALERLQDPARRAALATRGRNAALDRYSVEAAAALIDRVLREELQRVRG